MKRHLRTAVVFFIVIHGGACVQRQIKPVSTIDPAPLVEKIMAVQATLEKGASGRLELTFKKGRKTVRSSAYIVAFPDGRFRLEVPGPFGGTHVVMTNDNREILAFCPYLWREKRAPYPSSLTKFQAPGMIFP